MVKNETAFSNYLHGKFELPVYFEKTNNPWRWGTPDFYYEGPAGILWSEHKWIKEPWTEDVATKDICKTQSWPKQVKWLNRAHDNGVNTCVIVGVGVGRNRKAYWLSYPYGFSFFYDPLYDTKTICNRIYRETNELSNKISHNHLQSQKR